MLKWAVGSAFASFYKGVVVLALYFYFRAFSFVVVACPVLLLLVALVASPVVGIVVPATTVVLSYPAAGFVAVPLCIVLARAIVLLIVVASCIVVSR